jgi:hypothetical protein
MMEIEENAFSVGRLENVQALGPYQGFVVGSTPVTRLQSNPIAGVVNFEYVLSEPLCAEDFFSRVERRLPAGEWSKVAVSPNARLYEHNDSGGRWDSHMSVRVEIDPRNRKVTVNKR